MKHKYTENDIHKNGVDYRFKNTKDFDFVKNIEIMENIKKKNIMDQLKNNKTSIFDKLKIISDNYILDDSLSYNISAGGLMDDFYFNF